MIIIAKSKGIPRSIDLTENGVFIQGVDEYTLSYDEISKTLPWDTNGNKRVANKISTDYIYADLSSLTTTRLNVSIDSGIQFTNYIDYDLVNSITEKQYNDFKLLQLKNAKK